jgi:hypothetical protein
MHFKSLLHVRDHSKARGRAHHLLQTIAQHVNLHTREAFGPSVERLAARLDVTPQWVRQLRARLVAEGELILKPSRGRHPNVYIIPYERCPACQGVNPQVESRVEINPDDSNPKVSPSEPDTQPETSTAPTQNVCPANPKVDDPQPATRPESLTLPTRNSESANPKVAVPQPESREAPTRNVCPPNPKLREPLASVLARIELRKEFSKEGKEKKEGATRNMFEIWLDKAERQSPYWCEAHRFCHVERLPDHWPDCARER